SLCAPVRLFVGAVIFRLLVATGTGRDRLKAALEGLGGLPFGHPGRSRRPRLQKLGHVVALGGDEVKGSEIGLGLRRRQDAALMRTPKRLGLPLALSLMVAWCCCLRGGIRCAPRTETRASRCGQARRRSEKAAAGSLQLATAMPAHGVASTKVFTSSST